ncbi:MAG TPA: hypothetical protein VF230_01735, partial [Acidimicrobiales bacterium]
VLLFVPVFLAFIVWRLPGGALAGILAALAYSALRLDAIDAVGGDRFVGLIATRTLGYVAFGLLGGWAVQQLETSLEKLDAYDLIDDWTKLFNARFFLSETGLEMARARRYQSHFSVVVVDVPGSVVQGVPRRRRAALLGELGRAVQSAVRTVDRGVHAEVDGFHRLAVICPETGAEGAAIFTGRLATQIADFFDSRNLSIDEVALAARSLSFPGDDAALDALRADFERVEREQHPETATTA